MRRFTVTLARRKNRPQEERIALSMIPMISFRGVVRCSSQQRHNREFRGKIGNATNFFASGVTLAHLSGFASSRLVLLLLTFFLSQRQDRDFLSFHFQSPRKTREAQRLVCLLACSDTYPRRYILISHPSSSLPSSC